MTLAEAVEELEIKMIREALSRHKQHFAATARALGLSYQGLLNKLRRYGFEYTKKPQKCWNCGVDVAVPRSRIDDEREREEKQRADRRVDPARKEKLVTSRHEGDKRAAAAAASGAAERPEGSMG